ncbi:NADH dehydrogenase [ubiquinone] iron-sulfur protein 3, mitochondrial-like [Trichoplusia ni]|uniref:NADH dehydrogenase [ubiquinone] iron-sulfur protein 3, mitochondrial n=1 Tax=Trichoplusia ni TaxID=7111 RepID=A0A7E5VTS3_TRINI|nr:NADH dehydrogenase [ubiquinone] iron-sulfur protein 3, mitochondrial-like [Trichoplusia ni]
MSMSFCCLVLSFNLIKSSNKYFAKMNGILTKLAKSERATVLLRKFHNYVPLLTKNVQVKNPFQIEPIEAENHTLRVHDNTQRQRLYEFGMYVGLCLPKFVQKVQMQHTDELEILVVPEGLNQVLSFMKLHQHACFYQCSSATAIDVPSRVFRFEVCYNILSFRFGERARVKTYTDELTPLHSAYNVWKSCQWYEREIYDMFGIVYTHHPDLRRILTDYGFQGHPLRKDFPLVGYIEVRYDDELKKLVYEPMEYPQEAREYELQTPWHYLTNFHDGYNAPKKDDKKK